VSGKNRKKLDDKQTVSFFLHKLSSPQKKGGEKDATLLRKEKGYEKERARPGQLPPLLNQHDGEVPRRGGSISSNGKTNLHND